MKTIIEQIEAVVSQSPKASKPELWLEQTAIATRKRGKETCKVTLRFDDQCGNGHNSFSITGEHTDGSSHGWSGGCLHEIISDFFPELMPFIKWHFSSSGSPIHYIADTIYHASDKDCWGRRKGEPSAFQDFIFFGNSPIGHPVSEKFVAFLAEHKELILKAIPYISKEGRIYEPEWTFEGYEKNWGSCPFNHEEQAKQWKQALETLPYETRKIASRFSEGKERDLAAARRCAAWPEATDEELMAEDLKEKLEARLPALVESFKEDIAKLGLKWSPNVN